MKKFLVLLLLVVFAGITQAAEQNDLELMAWQWLKQDCAADSWCLGSDLNYDAAVDLEDFELLARYWLDPEG